MHWPGQIFPIREDLQSVRGRLLLHPRNQYLPQARRICAGAVLLRLRATRRPRRRSSATNINNDRGTALGFNLNGVGSGTSDLAIRSRAVITVDTREQTDYGVLRTYFLIGHTGDAPNAEGLYANRGFIQFAGFTFGLAQSFFDFFSAPAVSYFATNTEDTGDGGWRVAAFTANFGNGITSTLSLEEPRRLGVTSASLAGQVTGNFNPNGLNIRTQFNDPFLVGAVVPQGTGSIKAPDIVYNTRLDQQWGAIMLGGAVTDVDASYYGANATSAGTGLTSCAPPGFNAVTDTTSSGIAGGGSGVGAVACGHPADKLGWVATGGLRLNVPGGSYLQMQGSYTQGALRYISHTQWPFGSAARFGVGNSVGLGWLMDGIYGNSGEIELTRAWGIYASWEQVWNPKWKTSIYGGWTSVSYDDNAKALIAASTCGNQAGAGSFLPGAITTAALAALPHPAVGLGHQRDQLRSQLADGLRRHPHPVEHHLPVLHGRGCPLHQDVHRLRRARHLPLCGHRRGLGTARRRLLHREPGQLGRDLPRAPRLRPVIA